MTAGASPHGSPEQPGAHLPEREGAATTPRVASEAGGWEHNLIPGLIAVCLLAMGEGVYLGVHHPPGRQPLTTIVLLLSSAVLALVLGTLALSAGPHVGLGTIRRKMVFSASIGVVFTLGDALLSAHLMFVSPADASVLLALLLFSLLISLALVVSLGGMLHRAVAILTRATRRMAAGKLDTVVAVESGDELAVLAADLQRMGATLAEEQRMRRGLEAARRDLVAGISHDLRTPLNALQAVTAALADGLVSEEPATATHYLQELDLQTARLALLVDDLFTLARLEEPAPELDRAPYTTSDLLSNVLERAGPLARAAAIRLDVSVDDATPDLLIDVRQIERVLDNLLRNALRYTPAGGVITVQAALSREPPTSILITVRDTGAGVAAADLPLLFERYFRGDGQRRGAEGSGLGLAIAKAVVQAHGGRIWADSPAPGAEHGAQISLTLPALADPALL